MQTDVRFKRTSCRLTGLWHAHKDDAWLAPPKHLLSSSHSLAQRALSGVLALVEDQGQAQAGPWDVANAKVTAVPQQQHHEGLQGSGWWQVEQGVPFSSFQIQAWASVRVSLLQCGGGTDTQLEPPHIG